MEIMERDPEYIAETAKLLREIFALTQENLADAANLTTRTIQKVESGRHRPNEQTLLSIARALNMSVAVFEKPTPTQERQRRADFERAIRKTLLVPTSPITDAQDVLKRFGEPHAYRFDMSSVTGDEAMRFAAEMADYVDEMMLAWSDMRQLDRLECARKLAATCERLRAVGHVCHLGRHGQQMRSGGKSILSIVVALVAVLPQAQAKGLRYAIVELEGAWETRQEDRASLPKDWFRANQATC